MYVRTEITYIREHKCLYISYLRNSCRFKSFRSICMKSCFEDINLLFYQIFTKEKITKWTYIGMNQDPPQQSMPRSHQITLLLFGFYRFCLAGTRTRGSGGRVYQVRFHNDIFVFFVSTGSAVFRRFFVPNSVLQIRKKE